MKSRFSSLRVSDSQNWHFLTFCSPFLQMHPKVLFFASLLFSASFLHHVTSAQTCDPAERLRVTVTLPPAIGFYTVLDVNIDAADVDANGRACLRETRYLPFAVSSIIQNLLISIFLDDIMFLDFQTFYPTSCISRQSRGPWLSIRRSPTDLL
jgi:hypothetical protein